MSTVGLRADNEVRAYDGPMTLSSASKGEGGMREQGDTTVTRLGNFRLVKSQSQPWELP